VCGNCVYKHFDKAYINKKCRKYSMNALFVTLAPVQGPILLNSFSGLVQLMAILHRVYIRVFFS